VDRLLALPAMQEALEQIGFGGGRSDGAMLLLSKPPFGPPLYWHQDLMTWNDPIAAAPWPTRIFLSFYMVDTTRESGCLRVIPGTHRKRIPLHDVLPPAHGPELQQAELDHPAFQDHPDAVDLPVKAGDLAINDARVLHAAHPNNTPRRRTLVLFWHSLSPGPPSWWTGEIPEVVRRRDPTATYEMTRIPGEHLPSGSAPGGPRLGRHAAGRRGVPAARCQVGRDLLLPPPAAGEGGVGDGVVMQGRTGRCA
jgi:hypothetical protein